MPVIGYVLMSISGLAVIAFAIQQFRSDHRAGKLIAQLAVVALIFVAVLHFLPPGQGLVSKGPEDNQNFLAAVAAIYVCIVLGMLAEAGYSWFDKTPTERAGKFDWGAALKPLFVSPIILVPTIGAFQNAKIDLMQLDFPRLMILLTAFEKGFLWRHYYLTRKAAAEKEQAAAKGAGE